MPAIPTSILAVVRRLWSYLGPLRDRVEPIQVVADLCHRSRRELIVENATLRHQLSVLRRTAGHPRLGLTDRLRLLVGAAFRLFWRHRSKAGNRARLNADTIELIRNVAKSDRLWGAERIRGELLKLGIKVSKRTIQKYMRGIRTDHGGQSWATFLANHAYATWACDFIQAYDILFRQVYAFFIVHLGSRKVVYTAACRNPTQEWTAQQLRNASMDGDAPKILLRDRDDKFGASFDRVAEGVGTRVIKTAVRAPDMNAVAERFVGSARREMLDHVIVLDDGHLGRLVGKYKQYFNEARPHQGIGQRIPGKPGAVADIIKPIVASPVLGGLQHDYQRAA